jgi:hypothetical protein
MARVGHAQDYRSSTDNDPGAAADTRVQSLRGQQALPLRLSKPRRRNGPRTGRSNGCG